MTAYSSSPIPRINLLCIEDEFRRAFDDAHAAYRLPSSVAINHEDRPLTLLPPSLQFDLIVSPANSHGIMDGGFDEAISRAFSPRDDYHGLTRVVQEKLYEEYKGFAPPGSCTLVRIPESFRARSNNNWGTKYLAVCPTMRTPQDTRWDKEVVYEVVWSLLCAIDKHNRTAHPNERIRSLLMTPMGTGTGRLSGKKWADQTVLAMKHFIDACERPGKWSCLRWHDVMEASRDVKPTHYL